MPNNEIPTLTPDEALDLLAKRKNLDDVDQVLIEKFLELKPEAKRAVVSFVLEVAFALEDEEGI